MNAFFRRLWHCRIRGNHKWTWPLGDVSFFSGRCARCGKFGASFFTPLENRLMRRTEIAEAIAAVKEANEAADD